MMIKSAAAAGQHAADRVASRSPRSVVANSCDRLPVRKAGRGTGPVEAARHQYAAAIARQLVGQILAVADAQICAAGFCPRYQASNAIDPHSDLRCRGGTLMMRRDLTLPKAGLQLRRDHLDMPVAE